MTKKLLVMLLGVLSCTMVIFAEEITAEQSQKAVEAWMKKYGAITGKTVRRIETIADPVTGAQIHVAVLRGGGFVVTAADDRVLPVMAYSETGTFINDPDNPLLQLLQTDASAAKEVFGKEEEHHVAEDTKSRLLAVSATATEPGRTDAQKEWDDLLGRTTVHTTPKAKLLAAVDEESSDTSSHTEKRVEPLLRDKRSGKQLLWGQLTHNDQKDFGGGGGLLCYNYYTPEWPEESVPAEGQKGEADNIPQDDSRLSTHYPCGCVATAGAMIMKKWEHPKSEYSFSSMPADPAKNSSENGRKAIGKLTRAIGRVCGASYGPETNMNTPTMVEKLVSSFSYVGAFWQTMQRSDFEATSGSVCNFDKQVIPNLIAGCPVPMSISGAGNHCVVVDGLRYVGSVRKYHVNFGWLIESANTWYVPQTFGVKYKGYDENGNLVTKTATYNSVKGIGINIHPKEKKAIIAGRVAYYTDGGLKGAVVILKKNGTKVNDATTDEHGQFHFLVDSGTYTLEISKTGYVTRTVSNVDVTCTGSSVQNYYKDIALEAESTDRVEAPDFDITRMGNGAWYNIAMSCKTEGATIHYTIDGSLPNESDKVYTGPFQLRETGTITLKAIAFKDGMIRSIFAYSVLSFTPSSDNTQLRLSANITTVAGKTSMNNAYAIKESGEPTHSVMGKAGGASMWASFTAPEDGDYTFTASGYAEGDEDYSLDTQLAVYTGSSVNALTLVAANDDVNAAEYDLSSKVAFRATKGVTYKIAVDTRNGEKGTINLEWKEGREDVASPVEYDVYYTAESNTYSIPIRSTATWSVCDGSDWITVKKGSGADGESLSFELLEMTEEGTRSGVLLVCAGGDGPSSTIRITQGTTSWMTSRADALATAKANGKRVLMVCGRDTCSNTSYTRFTACEDATVKPLLLEGYVLWYCNCDEQWEDYYYYTDGLGGYTLPLVCIIDPVRPDAYVARSTGPLTASQLRQLLVNNAEGDLPTQPFEVCVDDSAGDGTINVLWGAARRAQSYEVWRGTKWNPAEAVLIASDVRTERYIDDTAEPSVLYYYRVRAVNGVGVGELSMPAVGCWREAGANGDVAIGDALGAPHLDWATEGDYPWTVQGTNTYDGVTAMQSAFVDPKESGVTSVLKTTVMGPTKMSFRYKTRMYSSRFTVKIDGTEKFLVRDAVSDWTLGVVEIPAGSHEIEFSYAKGGYYTSGFNGVYLDSVQFDVVSDPPSLSPVTTDDEESAQTFTGSMAVSIDAPEGSVIYYTLDGSEPTRASQRYAGPFTLTASTRVKAICVQDGYDCSATVSGLYLERHPVQAGEWTTDVEGAKKAALKSGSIIVTLLANYDTCYYSQLFKEVSESAEFLSWARANGVYLITADSSRAVDAETAYSRFWDLFYDAGQSGSAYYPALAIANAWEPDKATGYAVARSGQNIGAVTYDGTATTLESGLRTFFVARPLNSYVWIEFDGNGGTPYERSRVGISGQTVGELPSAYRPYHYFKGWFTLADGGAEVSEGTVLNGDAVYYAHWTPYSYRIRFDANGGSVAPTYKYVYYGAEYGDLPTPVRTGNGKEYTFDGWFTKSNGGDRVTSDTQVAITAEQMLYAHWTERIMTYPVTYSPGAQGVGVLATDIKVHDVALPLNGVMFVRDGYTQTGWSIIDGGDMVYDLNATYTKNAALALYPYWTQNKMTVTFNSNGGAVVVPDTKDYVPGQTLGQLPVPTRRGYTLQGWWTSSSGGALVAESTIVSSNATYYAHWTPIRYSIQYDPNGGEGEMDDQSMVYDVVEPLSASQFAKSGSMFRGWSLVADGAADYSDCACVSNLTAVADDVVTFYAVWQEKPAAVTACEDVFDGFGRVSLDENGSIVVVLTVDVSGTVEIPDNVGAVTIDLNGHSMVGNGGPAIRVVNGGGEGETTRLAIVDTSDGEKGQILGGGESAGVEVSEDAATGVKLDVEEGVGVFNGDGSEQELKPKLVGAGKVTTPKTWKTGQKVTWKATADKGSVFAHWEGPFVDSLDLAKNERRNPSLAFVVPEGFETNQIKAVFIPIDDDGLYSLGITQTEFELKDAVSDVWVTDDSQSYVTATASGLPSGLKFNAKTLQITGAPTKSGVYWVQIKAKNASGYQWAEKLQVTVSGDGKEAKEPKLTRTAYYPLTVICATEGGTATGTGVYADGRKTTIKAMPAKGCVFAGWYETASSEEGIANSAGADYRSPSMSVVVPEMRYVFAKFATKEEDAASLALAVEDATAEKDGTLELDLGACVESLSLPKLSVAGLPSGIKYDAKTMTLAGKATKPGVYTVTVKATNASVTRATDATTATFKITVPNFECAALPGLKPETGAYGTIHAGVKFGPGLIDCTPEDGWTVKAAGLPAGLKFAAKETKDATYGIVPAWTIYGVPTAKAGAYTVTFTASKKGEKNQVATITLNVEALPAWAVGTFTGAVFDESDAVVGRVQNITVSSAGKISGKIIDGDMTWTLSAPSFDEAASLASEVGSPAFTATVIAKAGKEVATNAVTVAVVDDIGVASGDLGTVTAGAEAGPREWTAWRNVWKDAGRKEEAMALKNIKIDPARDGTVTFSAPSASGVVTARLKDGKYSATMSATLVPADSGYMLFWYFPPKTGKFAGDGGCEEVK